MRDGWQAGGQFVRRFFGVVLPGELWGSHPVGIELSLHRLGVTWAFSKLEDTTQPRPQLQLRRRCGPLAQVDPSSRYVSIIAPLDDARETLAWRRFSPLEGGIENAAGVYTVEEKLLLDRACSLVMTHDPSAQARAMARGMPLFPRYVEQMDPARTQL
eukprot:Hpha_TRINITY_DN16541_c0_g3::TRINITY_DN16541_c0_g3_i2::g.135999::m.135999